MGRLARPHVPLGGGAATRYGYGERLLRAAEDEAQGCQGVFLETLGFQARPFYERFAYEVFAELPDRPAVYTSYFMKTLDGEQARERQV